MQDSRRMCKAGHLPLVCANRRRKNIFRAAILCACGQKTFGPAYFLCCTVPVDYRTECTGVQKGIRNVEILDDLYSIGKELVPIRKEESYESLVVRNFARCKAAERLRLEPKKPRMLQICHSRGEVKIDDASVVPGGVKVEGAVEVSILYVTADDAIPFAVMEGVRDSFLVIID